MIKALIFDMDGVLVDATEWHYEALNRALSLFGYTITHQEHLEKYNGRPTKTKLQMLSTEKGLPISLHNFINDLKQKYTKDEIEKHCKPDLEKIKMLRAFYQQQYKIAVCSNAVRSSVETMLKNSGLLEYCFFYLSNEDVQHPKPSSEIYIKAIKKLELFPTECLIVEDSPLGIASARASGARVMEVKDFHEVTYKNIREVITRYDRLD